MTSDNRITHRVVDTETGEVWEGESPNPETDAKFELFLERVDAAAEQIFGTGELAYVIGARLDDNAVRMGHNLNSMMEVEYALTELHQLVAQYVHIQGLEGLQVEGGSEAEVGLADAQAGQEDPDESEDQNWDF